MSEGSSSPVSVDTGALDAFASNIDQLSPQVTSMIGQLGGIGINAGTFPEATTLAGLLNGGGFAAGLTKSLQALERGLGDLASATRKMSAEYKSASDASSVTAGDLLNGLDGDITSMSPSVRMTLRLAGPKG